MICSLHFDHLLELISSSGPIFPKLDRLGQKYSYFWMLFFIQDFIFETISGRKMGWETKS